MEFTDEKSRYKKYYRDQGRFAELVHGQHS